MRLSARMQKMAGKLKFTDAEMISALNIHEGNVTHAAESLGVTRSANIKRRDLLPKGALILAVEEIRRKRADVFADLQRQVLANITPDKMANCSAQQLATIAAILYDKERLELNQSTENIAHKVGENMSQEDRDYFKKFQAERTKRMREAVTYDDD
jgi:hypothetical protein